MKNINNAQLKAQNFQNQIDEYKTLPLIKTYRGQAKLILQVSAAIIIISSFFSNNYAIIVGYIIGQLLTFIPLSFAIGKGKKWAIVITEILWTFGFISGASNYLANIQKQRDVVSQDLLILVIFLAIYIIAMDIFIKAFKIEKLKQKK